MNSQLQLIIQFKFVVASLILDSILYVQFQIQIKYRGHAADTPRRCVYLQPIIWIGQHVHVQALHSVGMCVHARARVFHLYLQGKADNCTFKVNSAMS